MNGKEKKSEFLPAVRAEIEEVRHQTEYFLENGLMYELLEGVPDVVLVLNEQRQVVYANSAVLKVTDLEKVDEAYGLRPGELLGCVHAKNDTGGCGTTLFCRTCGAAHVILNGIRGDAEVQECCIQQSDGKNLSLLVWGRPFSYRGNPFVVFSIQDISSRTKLRVLERIFFHDILNAAGGIRNMIEILDDVKKEELQEVRQLLSNLSNDMIEIIQFQRDVKSGENGELKAYMYPYALQKIVEEVADRYRKNHLCQDRTIRVDTGGGDCRILSDGGLLRRCLGSIIKNTLETIRAGDEIAISWKESDRDVDLQVRNPGFIDPEVQQQIFQRSFSTKDTRRGFGSYGVKMIVENYLNGKVWFESSKKDGTCFHVRIPKET